MPAPLLSQSSTRTANKAASHKPRAVDGPTKKRRVVRRRRRARGELDSDEEIEREAVTDSDSDADDDISSTDSATEDSDTEPVSEDVVTHDRAHLPTPRNSKSPETVVKEETGKVNGDVPSFFAAPGDWADMVTDEKVHGPADLPVIEFANFSGTTVPDTGKARKPRKVNKAKRAKEARATSADSTHEAAAPPIDSAPSQSESRHQRVSSQSARQAYQHKLETDPSFVPTIGNFWGHDDRLIDTELRSLSGWWRGRGRGRGRGFAMRGRGGFSRADQRGQGGDDAAAMKEEDLPPIERVWTHDGFEELKRKEEQRRAEQLAAKNVQSSPKREGFVGGRGGFVSGRGRGGFVPRARFAVQPTPHSPSLVTMPGRVRFAMKPELMWTKHHEAFLYFEPALKPRPGHGPSYRVKLPGHESGIVRTAPAPRASPRPSTSKVKIDGSEAGDKYFVVRLPKRAGKEPESLTTQEDETPIEEVFKVRPQLVAAQPIILPGQGASSTATETKASVQSTVDAGPSALPDSTLRSQLEQLSLEPVADDPVRQAKTEEAVLRRTSISESAAADQAHEENTAPDRPALAPLQTTFSPPPPAPSQPISQRSPPYGSPYGYSLPLGVALNQHGMPYEVATGHPVYLQPPPMYNPRPLIPSHYPSSLYVPGHMHQPSPDFLAQPPSHTPPVNGFIDPATGTPIFSFPRQTSRVEIRAPDGKPKPVSRTSSNLRTAAPSFQPSRTSSNSENGYYAQSASEATNSPYEHASGAAPVDDPGQAGMTGMMYPYQPTYYYPEPYGYPQYVDMSQAGQYDMYSMDQTPQGTVYY